MPKNYSNTMKQKSEEAPQDPIDQRGPDYDNNHPMDWVRGKNEDATRKPHYDSGPKWFDTKKGK